MWPMGLLFVMLLLCNETSDDIVTLAFDILFKSFNVGMAVIGICHSQGHLCFTNTYSLIIKTICCG
jgi:hypothetical protein